MLSGLFEPFYLKFDEATPPIKPKEAIIDAPSSKPKEAITTTPSSKLEETIAASPDEHGDDFRRSQSSLKSSTRKPKTEGRLLIKLNELEHS